MDICLNFHQTNLLKKFDINCVHDKLVQNPKNKIFKINYIFWLLLND
jgi:hypothetical protein